MTNALLPPLLFMLLAPPGQEQDPFKISVNVRLVVLNATVRTRDKQFVKDLEKSSFEVYEDGVKQSLTLFRHEDTPVTVGLVIDHSGSMRNKILDVISAARTFVSSSNPTDELFVVNFNEHVVLGLPSTENFTSRSSELASAIARTPTIGMTALYDAVARSLEQLRTGKFDKTALVVISDGGDNASKRALPEILQMLGETNTLLYSVGLFEPGDTDSNPGVLKKLAQATGGEAYFPKLDDIVGVCEGIARDIRSQYTLGYVSTNVTGKPGTQRKIRVVAHRPDRTGADRTGADRAALIVRARGGYIAAGSN